MDHRSHFNPRPYDSYYANRPPPAHYYNPAASSSSSASASSSTRPSRMPNLMDGILDDTPAAPPPTLTSDPNFDIIDWHPAYQSCQRYFLDHAQHEPGTQALCALINIRLPFQWLATPIHSSTPPNTTPSPAHSNSQFNFPHYSRSGPNGINSPSHSTASNSQHTQQPPTFVSLIPYIRRLIITGFDKPPILHGFFGDDYARGISPHLDCERRNYLFAAKHGGWRTCKKHYDAGSGGGADECTPFMKPLDEAKVEEITAAEKAWSQWMAMEDWMVGPRAPEDGENAFQGSSQGSTARSGGANNGGDHMSDRAR
ncbi:hypothetical protein Q7P37_008878 [Cladosporium fusiforme]